MHIRTQNIVFSLYSKIYFFNRFFFSTKVYFLINGICFFLVILVLMTQIIIWEYIYICNIKNIIFFFLENTLRILDKEIFLVHFKNLINCLPSCFYATNIINEKCSQSKYFCFQKLLQKSNVLSIQSAKKIYIQAYIDLFLFRT